MNHIITIRINGKNHLFRFKSKIDLKKFLRDILKRDSQIEYAFTETK